VWCSQYFNDDFCDKIRAYIEECEHCQSIFDYVDGFSGVLGTFGGRVRQAGVLGSADPALLLFKNLDAPMIDSIRLVNIAMSFFHLNEFSALVLENYVCTTYWNIFFITCSNSFLSQFISLCYLFQLLRTN
jgi:hypothetical protein